MKKINIFKKNNIDKKKLSLELKKNLKNYDKYLQKYSSSNLEEHGSNKIIRIIKKRYFLIMKKNLFIFTGSRADYGILKNLVIDLKKEKKYNCKISCRRFTFFKKIWLLYSRNNKG